MADGIQGHQAERDPQRTGPRSRRSASLARVPSHCPLRWSQQTGNHCLCVRVTHTVPLAPWCPLFTDLQEWLPSRSVQIPNSQDQDSARPTGSLLRHSQEDKCDCSCWAWPQATPGKGSSSRGTSYLCLLFTQLKMNLLVWTPGFREIFIYDR